MKLQSIIISILLVGFLGCSKQRYDVVIKGKVIGSNIPDIIEFSNSEIGVCYMGFREYVPVDSLGNFEININIDKPMLIQLKCDKIYEIFLIIEKKVGLYNIEFNYNKNENNFTVNSENSEGENMINKLTYSMPNAFKTIYKYDNDTLTIEEAFENIAVAKNKEISSIKELLNNNKIRNDFFSIIRNDRDCYFAAVQATIAQSKFEEAFEAKDEKRKEIIKDIWRGIFNNINNEEYLITSNYNNLLERYIYYKIIESFDFNYEKFVEDLTMVFETGNFHTYFINTAKQSYTGDVLEYFRATYMWIEALQKNYEKEFVPLFEEFKEDYPNSTYTKYLEPMIIPIAKYHDQAKDKFSENIKYINDYENINSLSEAVKPFEGKKIFIDVWATWCGPCKYEFKFKDQLQYLLNEHDIQLLYISIDEDNRANQWKDMIKYYSLEGHHIRASEKLISDIKITYDSKKKTTIGIPFYILIDEKGYIIKKHLSKPSEIDKLEKELISL